MISISGCRTPHRVELTSTGAPSFQTTEIVYELDDPGRILGNESTYAAELVNYAANGTGNVPQSGASSSAKLTIRYPSPSGNTDDVRCTLLVTGSAIAGSKANSRTAHQVRILDVPKSELDLLLVDLANVGFFDDAKGLGRAAKLTVAIDRGQTTKQWDHVPRLDDFVDRVYREGAAASLNR